MLASHEIGFRVRVCDTSRPLVIDPVMTFSTYLGGSGFDQGYNIAVGAAGNAYVSGDTRSPDFPVVDAVQPTYGGGLGDAFATALNASGSALIWSTFLGANLSDEARAIALSTDGGAYEVGSTSSFNFPSTPGAAQPFSAGGLDYHDVAFVVKISGASAAPAADTVGVYMAPSGAFFLRDSNSSGSADSLYQFGPGGQGMISLSGDWNGDGVDTSGLYNPSSGTFFLGNANGSGPADLVFGFGPGAAGWIPIAGDWNGDGVDTIGLYSPASGFFFLKNVNGSGAADTVFGFGPGGAGWTPVAGDWKGDGADTVGLYSASSGFFYLKDANTAAPADLTFGYGPPNAAPLAGDWNGQ